MRAPDPVQQIKAIASEWLHHWYAQRKELELELPVEGGILEPFELHRIEVASLRATTGESIWSLVWSYPAEPDDTLLWQSNVTVSFSDGLTEVAIVIRIASREFRIAPPSFDVRRPYLVKTLVESLPCYLGERPLRASPNPVGVEDIPAFEKLIFNPERRLPIVLFSRDSYGDQCLASPSRTADALVGLAEVHVLNDKWAGFRLTSSAGRTFSCFNGAVRIYWPGLNREASSLGHKLFLPDEVRQLDLAFSDHLMRRFAPISALRLTEPASARKARVAVEADRASDVTQLREQLKAGTAAKEEVEAEFFKLIEERDAAISAKRTVESDRDDAQFRILQLEEENGQLAENIKAISSYRAPEGAAHAAAEAHEPANVREALDAAAQTFADRLVIWSSAEESADESSFARPNEVYEALMALRELAEAYFRSKRDGQAVGAWEDWLEHRGFKYSPKESQNTLNMYGKERDFIHQGEKRRMVRHLTLGGGDRTNCLQIYFDVDEGIERFLVGYCGPHLPYYGMRT